MAARRKRPSSAKRLAFSVVYFGPRNMLLSTREIITTSNHEAERIARMEMPDGAVTFSVFDQADDIRVAAKEISGRVWRAVHKK